MSEEAVYLTQALVDDDEKLFQKYLGHKSVKVWINEKIFIDELNNVDLKQGYDYTTSLLYAAGRSRHAYVRDIVNCGGNVKARDSLDNTVLHCACASLVDRHEKVAFLLHIDRTLTNVHNVHESTPLHIASLSGHSDVISLLIACGADVNSPGQFGNTAIHAAAEKGMSNTIYELMKYDADVNMTNDYGQGALHIAAENGHSECIQLLINAYKADINTQDNNGVTALHLASHWGHLKAVKILVFHPQCNKDIKCFSGKTALDQAIQQNHLDIVDFLTDLQHNQVQSLSNNTKYLRSQLAETERTMHDIGNVSVKQKEELKKMKDTMESFANQVKDWRNYDTAARESFKETIHTMKQQMCLLTEHVKELMRTLKDGEGNFSHIIGSDGVSQGMFVCENDGKEEERRLVEKIRAKRLYLIKNLRAVDHIGYLYQEKALSMDEKQIIEKVDGSDSQMMKLLDVLQGKKNPAWAPIFMESLKLSDGLDYIVEQINNVDLDDRRKNEII